MYCVKDISVLSHWLGTSTTYASDLPEVDEVEHVYLFCKAHETTILFWSIAHDYYLAFRFFETQVTK